MSIDRCNVCYYITGHGLGHATRSLELIRILLLSNKFNIHVVSQVNADFFLSNLPIQEDASRFTHSLRALDTGASQLDVFSVDPTRSLGQYYDNVESRRLDLIADEVKWLKRMGIYLVLVDATPLGCEAGRQAGAVTVLISNFSWDFCYKEMVELASNRRELTDEQIGMYDTMIRQCEADSSACDYYLQLPGATPLPRGFDESKLVVGPLLTRGLRNSELRADLGLPESIRVLLLGFGGHSTVWKLEDSFLPEGWICLVLGAEQEDMPSSRFRAVHQTAYVPDLIHLADAVLGKLGYGFVSECLTMGSALIYVPRQDWPEEKYLEILLTQQYNAGVRMTQQDFLSGHWETYITKAAVLKNSWSAPPTKHAGEEILRFITSIVSPLTTTYDRTH